MCKSCPVFNTSIHRLKFLAKYTTVSSYRSASPLYDFLSDLIKNVEFKTGQLLDNFAMLLLLQAQIRQINCRVTAICSNEEIKLGTRQRILHQAWVDLPRISRSKVSLDSYKHQYNGQLKYLYIIVIFSIDTTRGYQDAQWELNQMGNQFMFEDI